MKLYVTDHDGNEHQIEGVDGWHLMEAIGDEGLQIKAECGGACDRATGDRGAVRGWAPGGAGGDGRAGGLAPSARTASSVTIGSTGSSSAAAASSPVF